MFQKTAGNIKKAIRFKAKDNLFEDVDFEQVEG